MALLFSVAEKAIGLGPIPQGTVSWFLLYHIRGQNEGINSIKKKIGNLKGDGQWFSWKMGKNNISWTVKANDFLLKYQFLVNVNVMGQKRHGMRTIYNCNFFFIVWVMV